MDDVSVCRTDIKRTLSGLGQGTWHMGDSAEKRQEEIATLQAGIDLGLRVIDTAEMYGDGRSEKLVGEAIAGRREKIVLISKVLPSHASRKGTVGACEQSLKRLGTDRLDCYLLHWRGQYPLEETVAGMEDLMAAGKILSWGVSNFDVADMDELRAVSGGQACSTDQVLYNLTRRGIEFDLVPWCEQVCMPIMAYSPVEQGRVLNHPVLREIGQRHEATPAQIALAWVIRRPYVLAIPKASSVAHVTDNANARDIRLLDDDIDQLNKAFPPPAVKVELEVI